MKLIDLLRPLTPLCVVKSNVPSCTCVLKHIAFKLITLIVPEYNNLKVALKGHYLSSVFTFTKKKFPP